MNTVRRTRAVFTLGTRDVPEKFNGYFPINPLTSARPARVIAE